jgi:acyl-CoA thioesterase
VSERAKRGDAFTEATAVASDRHVPGRFHADIPDSWSSPNGVHGGMLIATITRAMLHAAPGSGHTLRTVNASFLDRPSSGTLVVDTEVVRVGGITAHVEARASGQGQDETAPRVWGLFTRPLPGPSYLDAQMPDVPAPDDCPADDNGMLPGTNPPLFDRIDLRPVIGTPPWQPGWTPGQPARYARWNRYHEPSVDGDGELDPLGLLAFADLPAPAAWVRFGPDDPFVRTVSLELIFNLLEPPTDEWILADFTARWLGDGYLLTQGDLWSAGRLVAYTSQIMLARPLEQPMVQP